MARTLSIARDPAPSSGPRAEPHLFLVALAHRPAERGLRASLAAAGQVALGRGDRTAASRSGDGNIDIVVDDAWMSEAHARMTAALGRWQIEDAGSKNGTLVNGQRVSAPRVLADGDLIELGHTMLRYRAAVEVGPQDPAIAIAGERAPAPALATLWPALAQRFDELARVATSQASIVISGPTGSGKEVVARAVHALSGRPGAFVAINCGALPETLVETEVFGYRRGAFSGAAQDRPGLIRAADRGTLFLDEVAELPAPAQVAFLRALQEREVVPVGGARPVPVDIRLVSATHRDVDALVQHGVLREDFTYRLAGFHIDLPPLRERIEDLGILLAALLERHGAASARFDVRALRCLVRHAWPGNIRELERAVVAAIALAGDAPIAPEHLSTEIAEAIDRPVAPIEPTADPDARRERLVELLEAHRGNIAAVARELGKAPMQIRRWLKHYGIDPEPFRR